jgi:phosphatidylinositol alpha-1,6-mannosyltransferase
MLMAARAPRVFFGSALLAPGRGGIARVARITARALAESDAARVEALSYLDDRTVEIAGLRASAAHGSKLLYALGAWRLGLRATHALYDSVGVARAHPRFARTPYGVWLHGVEAWGPMPQEHRAAAQRADLVLVNSRTTLERHQAANGPLANPRLCWLGTEQDEPPGLRARFEGPPRALLVGRIEAPEGRKGHYEMVDVWPKVVAAVPGARLIVAGAGTGLEALRRHAAASPAAASIDVLGHVPEEGLPALFASAHVYAMPSRQEGFGIAYIEAMRFGLPIIASLDDAGCEINVDGETGYNVAAADRDRLADCLIELLRSPDRCAVLGAAAAERWRIHFRYSCFAQRFLAIWNEFASIGGRDV